MVSLRRLRQQEWRDLRYTLVPKWIEEAVDDFEASPDYAASSLSCAVEQMSPLNYERHCAALLNSFGWSARLTKGSGDQGADVVAEKGGLRVVLQCKKYSRPVGNKAVQEVLAAMKFEDAHFAAVVSNAAFTPAAVARASRRSVRGVAGVAVAIVMGSLSVP
jgi:restriction system protein